MNQVILGLDHAVIAVKDLEAARAAYVKLGFAHAPMGDHQNRATANYCIMFPDTYLELLGINQQDLPDFGIKDFLATYGEGFQRVANGTADADAIAGRLREAGLEVTGPVLLERPQEHPKGMVTFHNVMIPPAGTAGIWTFFCCHKTPALMRTPEWMEHRNGAVAFASATSVVEDVASARTALAKLYGVEAVTEAAHGLTANLPRGKVHVTTPEKYAVLHVGARAPAGPLPRWYGLRTAVRDLRATEQHLLAQRLRFEKLPEGSLRLPAGPETCGVLLEFVAA